VIGKHDARLTENKDKGDLGNAKKKAEAFPEEVRVM
jgi:U3 small nucleolar RNA-associated protein 24